MKYLKRLWVILLIIALLFPITKVFAFFDEGDSTVFFRIPEGHGSFYVEAGDEEDHIEGTKRIHVPGGTELTLRAEPEDGYHLVGWFGFQEVDSDGQGTMTYPLDDEPICINENFTFTVGQNSYSNIAPVFAEGTALEEIHFTGEIGLETLEEGTLPTYTVATTTEHVSIEAYGDNTNWAKLQQGNENWNDFGAATPTATDDGSFYAMKLAVHVDDGYIIKPTTKIFYNNRDMYDTYTSIEPYEWGAYVYIDFGQIRGGQNNNPEPSNPEPTVVGNQIVQVALDVDLPRVGDTITLTENPFSQGPQANVHIGDNDPYELDNKDQHNYAYYFGENGAFFGGKFETGKTYTIQIWITPREGYEFPDNVSAFVNGEPANFLRDENGYIVEYAFQPQQPDTEYTIKTTDNSVIAIFDFAGGYHFTLDVVDILTLTPEEIEQNYGVPAEYIDKAIATIKNNTKEYGELLSVYAIEIYDQGLNYSAPLTLKFKMTKEMEKYTAFKFIFLDENNEFKVQEVHSTKIETIDGEKYVVIDDLNHLSTYALVGYNTSNSNNPNTGDKIEFYILMFSLSMLGLIGIGTYTKKKYFNKV